MKEKKSLMLYRKKITKEKVKENIIFLEKAERCQLVLLWPGCFSSLPLPLWLPRFGQMECEKHRFYVRYTRI